MVCLGIAVPLFSADMDFLHIFFQLFRIFHQLFIMTLLHRFMTAAAMNKCGFIDLPHLSILAGGLLQVFWCILRIDTELCPSIGDLFVDLLQKFRDLIKQAVSGFLGCLFSIPRNICLHLPQTWNHRCTNAADPHALFQRSSG